MRNQSAPTVFPETQHGEADHLGAATGGGRTARDAAQADGQTDGRRTDRKREHGTDDHRHDDAHQEGLHLRGVFDEGAEGCHHLLDGCSHGVSDEHAADDDHSGRDQDVDLGLFIDHLAQLDGHDDRHVGTHRAAEFVAGNAHGDGAKQHQALATEFVGNGHGDGRTRGGFGVFCDGHESLNARLVAQSLEDGADEQRGEQTECHSTKSVDKIGLPGHVDALAL